MKKNLISKILMMFVLTAMVFVIKPMGVFALTDDEIKDKKEITLKSVPITNADSLFQANESLYDETGYQLIDCNVTYTTCAVYKGVDETDIVAINVTIKYEYDEDVKRVVDGIIEGIPVGGKQFYIEDMHMIRWILDQVELDKVDDQNNGINPIRYSPVFNSFIGYNNFFFEPRMGEDTMYANFAEGTMQFKYEGTIYGYGHMATRVNHVLYVSDTETDVEGALKTRLSKYFNIDKIVKDPDVTIQDMINDELDMYRSDYNDCVTLKALQAELAALTDQEEINAKENEIQNLGYYGPTDLDEQYTSADAYAEAMREVITDPDSLDAMWNMESKVLPNVYVIYFTDGGDELSSGIPVFVAKDSNKIFNDELEVITRDAKSGVTVNTVGTSKKLPFDTLVKVSKITSGADYNKVISALESLISDENAIEMFDLKLFSNAIEDYITELDDGSFKVKIPISDKLKNAPALVAYYVDNNNKVQKYPVTIEMIDNVRYAVFTTDHFSIYTLAEDEQEPEPSFDVTYDFNGGNRQGETEYHDTTVAIGLDITKEVFIDNMTVTAPQGKELDAIEINGTRTELGGNYIIDKPTVFKYLWKDIENEENPLPDTINNEGNNEPTTSNPQTGDKIMQYVVMFGLSSLGLLSSGLYLRKKEN